MRTETRLSNLFIYLLVAIQFVMLFFMSMILKNQDTKIQELEADNQKIRQELVETENKCARMTDACIHILAEGVWE